MGYIYILHNMETDKAYIGKTTQKIEKRLNGHLYDFINKRYNSYLYNAIRKYGWNNFKCEIVCECNNGIILNELEKFFIAYYDTYYNGYNLTFGGSGGSLPGKDSRRYGKQHSLKTKDKISKTLQGRFMGKDNPVARPITLIHPSGKEEGFDCMRDAYRKYSLSPSHLSAVARGKRNHHKGFKVRYINE